MEVFGTTLSIIGLVVSMLVIGWVGCTLVVFGTMSLTPTRRPMVALDWILGIVLWIVGLVTLAALIPLVTFTDKVVQHGLA